MSGGGAGEHLGLLHILHFCRGKSVPIWTQIGETKTFSSLPGSTHLPGISSVPSASSWQPALGGQDTDVPAFGGADREEAQASSSSINPQQENLPWACHRTGIMPTLQALCVSPGMSSRNLMKKIDCQ